MPLNIDWQQILLHLLNFAILYFGLFFLLYKPVRDFMDKRRQQYSQMDETARQNLEESEKMKAEYAEKLKNADEEIEQKKRESENAINELKRKQEQDARKKAENILEEARRRADVEYDNIIASARKDVEKLAELAAEKVVKHDVGTSFDEFLDDVERSLKDGTNNS